MLQQMTYEEPDEEDEEIREAFSKNGLSTAITCLYSAIVYIWDSFVVKRCKLYDACR